MAFDPVAIAVSASLFFGAKLLDRVSRKPPDPRELATDPSPPARFVVGRARIAGRYADFWEETTGDVRTAYFPLLLCHGEIDDIERIWVNGIEWPFARAGGAYTTLTTAFDAKIRAIELRMAALTRPYRNGGVIPLAMLDRSTFYSTATDGERAAFAAMNADRERLLESKEWPWAEAADRPNIRIWHDLGGSGTSPADTRALASADDTGWSLSHKMAGLSWAWVELTQRGDGPWSPNGQGPAGLPRIEFLVKGAKASGSGAWTENAAEIAAWYLRTVCGVSDAEIASGPLNAAITACAASVSFPAVTRSSANYEAVMRAIYGGTTGWPTAEADIDRVLTAWNGFYAGSANARPRWTANGVIHGDEKREDVLTDLAIAMGGFITDSGGVYHIRAGTPGASAPSVSIGESDVVGGRVTQRLAPAPGEWRNVFLGRLVQDRRNEYLPNDAPRSEASDADTVGRHEHDLGELRFVNGVVTAHRVMGTLRRQVAPQRRRISLYVRPGADWAHYVALEAGARTRLRFPNEGISASTDFRILKATHRGDGAIGLEAIEEPAGVYSDALVEPALPPTGGDITGAKPAAASVAGGATIWDYAWKLIPRAVADAIAERTLVLTLSSRAPATRLLMYLEFHGAQHSGRIQGYWLPVPTANRDGAPFGHVFRERPWVAASGTFEEPTLTGDDAVPDAPTTVWETTDVQLASPMLPLPYTLSIRPYNGDDPTAEATVLPLSGASVIPRVQDAPDVDTLPTADGQVLVYNATMGKYQSFPAVKVWTGDDPPTPADADFPGQVLGREEA